MIHILEAKCEEGQDDKPNVWHLVKYNDEIDEIWREDIFEYKMEENDIYKETEKGN